MRRLILILLVVCPALLKGQNIAYFSSDSILKSVPEYGLNVQKIDSMRMALSKEIEVTQNTLQQQYDKLIKAYSPREKETLSQIKQRMSAVDTLSLNVVIEDSKQLQNKKQNYERILKTSYDNNVQPILNRISDAVGAYARENKITMVLILEQMRASVAFIDPKQNITDAIIGRLKGKMQKK